MAFRISPGVSVREIDLTTVVPAVATSSGGFVGPFSWGPVEKVVVIDSENTLASTFGKPTNDNATFFFMAANFLSYSNNLKVVRVVNSTSSVEQNATNSVANTGYLNITLTAGSGYTDGTYSLTISAPPSGGVQAEASLVVSGGALSSITWVNNGAGYTTAPTISIPAGAGSGTSGAITTTLVKTELLIKNEDIYNSQYSAGEATVGPWAAKYPGKLGNSIKISICASSASYSGTFASVTVNNGTATVASGASNLTVGSIVTFAGVETSVLKVTGDTTFTVSGVSNATYTSVPYRWEYATSFTAAPGTSDFALDKTGVSAADELHVVVVDSTGLFSGTKNYILEKYAFVSKISDAKTSDGSSNYYVNVVNRNSAYVWWMDHAVSQSPAWGSGYASVTTAFPSTAPITNRLYGGQDSADLTDSTLDSILQVGYDLFKNTEEVDVSLLICPPVEGTSSDGASAAAEAGVPTVKYVIQNVAEYRKDCVAFLSPRKKDVVSNVGGELADVLGYRNTALNINSSYAVMDSGWKYQYDKYNDVYRWVPLCADIAGLCAQTDRERDAWFSPAGYNRGNIKNVVKLAWNPREAYRDELYAKGINPVVSFPGQGIVLFGDKTLQSKPSAFDRINVRRLFIVLEKAIATASKFTLFELNDSFTRASFVNLVEPYLRDVKGRRGIYDFKVVCDETNNTGEVIDRNEFIGDIYIKPARSINFIQLNFIAVRTGVAFEEIVGKF